MSEILTYLVPLLIGVAIGLALRKKSAPEDHSECARRASTREDSWESELAELKDRNSSEIADQFNRHTSDINWLREKFAAEKAEYEKTAFLVPAEVLTLVEKAKTLVSVLSKDETGMSGEAKRHQVYARLIKDCPEATRNDIALAIEFAVRGL